MSYPFEPYKIKVLDQIDVISKNKRTEALKKAAYNLFKIPAEKVTIDFLTDSGTSSLSQGQWAQMMLADESYAHAKSWERFEIAVKEFTGKREVIPVHQGRAAEKIIAEVLIQKDTIGFANGFFDTTRANFEHAGAVCIDIPAEKSFNLGAARLFKGDIDLKKLKESMLHYGKRAKVVLMTLTNNTGGGQPASLKNVKLSRDIAKKNNLMFIVDACRIAENAFFIWQHEYKRRGNIKTIIRKLFDLSDIAYMSTKKDGLANSGGFIVTNNRLLAEKIRELAVLYEGFITYGGMTGRDMETIASGLKEVVEISYLRHRIDQVAYLHKRLSAIGVPMIAPPGGHAVYIDSARLFNHVKKSNFPGQALAVALYKEGGLRSVEVGSLMLGKSAKMELVRLAIPRRTYTQSHFDYVVDTFKKVVANKQKYKGFIIAWQPSTLRHFTCKLKSL